MWRFITRGVRDLKYSPSKQVDSTENVQKPSLLTKKKSCCILDYKAWRHPSCFQWTKASGKSEQSNHNTEDKFNHPHTLFEAVGWSGAIVFGWYVGQSILRNRNYFFAKKDERTRKQTEFRYKRLSELVTKVVLAQPQYNSVLPIQSTSYTTVPHESVAEETYGPITKEDNFDQAAMELLEVHRDMLAELENVRGMKLLKKKKSNDAIAHFKQAVLLNHSCAAFNLAQCYEHGWGTERDLSQAVYYYELAMQQGHASAIYNLGVYYSNGLGGLQVDTDKANELFLTAAKLGHILAAQHTGLVKCPAPSLEDLSKMFEDQHSKSPYPSQIIEAIESYMKSNDITPDEAYHSDEQETPLWNSFVREVTEYNQLCNSSAGATADSSNKLSFEF